MRTNVPTNEWGEFSINTLMNQCVCNRQRNTQGPSSHPSGGFKAIKITASVIKILCKNLNCAAYSLVGLVFALSFANLSFACTLKAGESVPTLMFPPKFKGKTPAEEYSYKLLQLVLLKSEDRYGPCEARLLKLNLPIRRVERYLESKKHVEVINFTVTQARDRRFMPVKIPIDKGLMGMRLSFIRKGDQERFSNIKDIKQLKVLVAGQGEYWKDVDILRFAGLKVIENHAAEPLPNMLAHNRFDYIPRGALQLIPELKIYEHLPIEVEKSFVISYPSFSAYYVHKDNKTLAERLEYGLIQAFEDGSFEQFFSTHPETVAALNKIQLETRRQFKICNPFAPAWVPTHIDKYWISPWPKSLQNKQCVIDQQEGPAL